MAVCLRTAALSAVFLALTSLVPSAVRADEPGQSWTLHDHLGVAWTHDLVFLPLDQETDQGSDWRLEDEQGRPVPFQFSQTDDGQSAVALLVDLPANGTRTFRLTWANQPVQPTDTVKVEAQEDYFILRAGRTAVKVGRPTDFIPGAAFHTLPPPIASVLGASGRWLGEGSLHGSHPVTAFTTEIEAAGPVFAQARVRYELGPRKFYQVRIRVIAGEDVVLVDETFALSEDELAEAKFVEPPDLAPPIGEPSHLNDWLINRGGGWMAIPTEVGKFPSWRFNFTGNWGADSARGLGIGQAKAILTPQDLAHAKEDWRLGLVLTPWQERGYRQQAIGFEDDRDYLGVFYRFGSRWVNPSENRVLMPWTDQGVVGHFLAYEGRRLWGIFVTETGPHNDFDPGKRDERTFSALHHILARYGETPLNKVKDWTLAWTTPADAYWPRIYYPRGAVDELRRQYAQLPDNLKEKVDADAAARALLRGELEPWRQQLRDHLTNLRYCVVDFLEGGHNTTNTYTHRFQELVRMHCEGLDAALANPALTAEERAEALAVAAFLAYKLADPDYWPYHGYGGGPSNPNMMSIATDALAHLAALCAGHPMQAQWLSLCHRLAAADVLNSIGPRGTWLESPGYQGAGNTPLNETVLILRNAGVADLLADPELGERLMSVPTYFANLLTPPDPRFDGRRMPMALGDNIPYFATHYTYLAAPGRQHHPVHSGHAIWCWQEMGRPVEDHALLLMQQHVLDGTLPAQPIDGDSVVFPAFGAMLRHGFGTPHETFLTYRQSNFAYGHYDEDQGSFSWFAKGAPLALDWVHYSPGEAEHHNRVDYGDGEYDWLVPPFDTHALKPGADYLRGHEGEHWQRQLILITDESDPADATYLVVRDRVTADGPVTWNAWVMAEKGSEQIDGDIARFKGQFGVDLSVIFYRKPEAPLTTTFLHHRTPSYIEMDQDQTRVQATGADGGEFGVVLYPRRRGVDAEPTVREVQPGVIELTWESGRRHLIVLSPDRIEVNLEGRTFKGCAAVLKIEQARQTFIPLE